MASCGGGGGDNRDSGQVGGGAGGTGGEGETPRRNPPGGDPSDPAIFRAAGEFGPFQSPVVAVAVSSGYVYVATENNLFAFTKDGVLVGQAGALPITPLVDVEVLPNLVSPLADGSFFPFPEYPVVMGQPGPDDNPGITIFAPNLDDDINIGPDQGAGKFVRLPRNFFRESRLVPNTTRPPDAQAWFQINSFNGLEVMPNGEIVARARVSALCTQASPPVMPSAIIIFDFLRGDSFYQAYVPSGGHDVTCPQAGDEFPGSIPAPLFDRVFGDQTGAANEEVASRFALGESIPKGQFLETESFYEDFNLSFDFYGRSRIVTDISSVPFEYSVAPPVFSNPTGYQSIIGTGIGSLPGQFAGQGPPEDPRLAGGGPAGLAVDHRTGEIYVADPGNRRVQVFDRNGFHLRDIGSGLPGTTGNNLIAPIDVAIDEFTGTVYIADLDRVRVFERVAPNRLFGSLGGRVFSSATEPPSPLAEATVTISDNLGLVAAVLSDSEGIYRVDNLPVGTYVVTGSKAGFRPDQGEVNLIPDELVIRDLVLEPIVGVTTGGVQGVVREFGTNLPINQARVEILGTSLSTTTGLDGSYKLNDIQEGQYQIAVSKEGYQTVVRDLFISERTVQIMNFTLVPLPSG